MSLDRPVNQQGSVLVIALFVMVILGLLVAAIARLMIDSNEKYSVEVLSVRALMAAHSGVEMSFYQLYPNGVWQAAASDANGNPGCAKISTSPSLSGSGFSGCSVSVSCSTVSAAVSTGVQTSYRLTSTGVCHGGGSALSSSSLNTDFSISRTIQAEAFDGSAQ